MVTQGGGHLYLQVPEVTMPTTKEPTLAHRYTLLGAMFCKMTLCGCAQPLAKPQAFDRDKHKGLWNLSSRSLQQSKLETLQTWESSLWPRGTGGSFQNHDKGLEHLLWCLHPPVWNKGWLMHESTWCNAVHSIRWLKATDSHIMMTGTVDGQTNCHTVNQQILTPCGGAGPYVLTGMQGESRGLYCGLLVTTKDNISTPSWIPREHAQPGLTGSLLDRAHSVYLESEIPWPNSKWDTISGSSEEVGAMARPCFFILKSFA